MGLDRIPGEDVGRAVERREGGLERRQHMVGERRRRPAFAALDARTGRDWLIRKISFMRTAKIWPVTSLAEIARQEDGERRDLLRRPSP